MNKTDNLAKLIIAKHRSGEPGDVNLRFVERFVRFENMYDSLPAEPMILNSQMNRDVKPTTLEKDETIPF